MRVAIDARATRSFGIIQMNCREALPRLWDNAVEFEKCFLHRNLRPDSVTGSKNVSGIKANTQPFRLAHIVNDVRDLFEAMTKARALASCGFERDLRFHVWNHAPDPIDRRSDLLQAGFITCAEWCAGMYDQKWQLEVIGPNQLLC